ncbi:MAG: MFS transporter [Sarcina sp.]
MSKSKLKREHLIFVIIIGIALSTRQLAMNIVTPFVASYAQSLMFGTLVLGGIALGIYNLTQGFFQVPFGKLYDKIGGKKVVLMGLFLLILGLLLAVIANNAYEFVISRALQGSGAITAAGYSWISKEVDEEERADAISIVGTFIGLASAIALGGGPLLIKFVSVRTLYLLSTIIVVIVFLFVLFFIKEDKTKTNDIEKRKSESSLKYLKNMFKNKNFRNLTIIAFVTNYVGIAAFFIIPQYVEKSIGLDSMWEVLTPAVIISVILMKITTKFIKNGKSKIVTMVSILFMIFGGILLVVKADSILMLFIISVFIFGAYTILAALIPTIVNEIAKDEFRGILNGVMNGFIYIGSFLGATISGVLWQKHLEIALYILLFLGIVAFIAVLNIKHTKMV